MAKSSRPPSTRVPVQKRSQETFEIILLGAARVLLEVGYEKLNTNKIAEAAGVNVATLYQYFPNKEAIISELVDREIDRNRDVFLATLPLLESMPLARGLPLLIKAMVELHTSNPKLQPAIHQALPLVGRTPRLQEAEEICVKSLYSCFQAKQQELRAGEPGLAAFMTVKILSRISEEILACRPELFAGDKASRELTELLLSYLVIPSSRPASPTI